MQPPNPLRLTLYYVSGHEPSRLAEERLRGMLEASPGHPYELELVDLGANPERAEEDRVLACPTIIKQSPHPVRRIIGDLSALDQVRDAIGIT